MSRAGAARQPSRAPVAPSGNQPRVWGRQGGDPYSKALDFAPRQNRLQLGSDKAHSSLARASSAWCGNLQAPMAKATLWLCFHLALAPSGGVRRASSFGTTHRAPKRGRTLLQSAQGCRVVVVRGARACSARAVFILVVPSELLARFPGRQKFQSGSSRNEFLLGAGLHLQPLLAPMSVELA